MSKEKNRCKFCQFGYNQNGIIFDAYPKGGKDGIYEIDGNSWKMVLCRKRPNTGEYNLFIATNDDGTKGKRIPHKPCYDGFDGGAPLCKTAGGKRARKELKKSGHSLYDAIIEKF